MHFPVTEGIVVHCKIGEVTSAQAQLDRTDQRLQLQGRPVRAMRACQAIVIPARVKPGRGAKATVATTIAQKFRVA